MTGLTKEERRVRRKELERYLVRRGKENGMDLTERRPTKRGRAYSRRYVQYVKDMGYPEHLSNDQVDAAIECAEKGLPYPYPLRRLMLNKRFLSYAYEKPGTQRNYLKNKRKKKWRQRITDIISQIENIK